MLILKVHRESQHCTCAIQYLFALFSATLGTDANIRSIVVVVKVRVLNEIQFFGCHQKKNRKNKKKYNEPYCKYREGFRVTAEGFGYGFKVFY